MADGELQSSPDFYDELAPAFGEFFAVPHRKMYDDLAWERTIALPLVEPGVVVDLGCGTARWARRFAAAGWTYVGVDDAPKMAAEARRANPGAHIIAASMDDLGLAPGCADLVVAMGSLQYSRDAAGLVRNIARWLRAGAWASVLVDSCLGLVMELVGAGRVDEARERLRTRRSRWVYGDAAVEYALLDAASLGTMFRDAGFVDVGVCGVLVGMTAMGRDRWYDEYRRDPDALRSLERTLSAQALTADAGKHVLVTARLPSA